MEAQQVDKAALLRAAQQAPAGVKLEEYNPLENIPTLTVGDDITEGMTLVGTYMGTQIAKSLKFKFATERDEATGLPIQRLHVLRLSNGSDVGIWTCGELRLVFDKAMVGEVISITYKGKGENANGQQQHFFDYKKASPAPVAN